MKRKIIKIDEKKCNGCGLCINACHEGAIQLVNGKAKLISESFCDGLGDCLPECPTGAITLEEREAEPFDEEAVKRHLESQKETLACGCPGNLTKTITKERKKDNSDNILLNQQQSQLNQWPCQIKLIPANAAFFEKAHLLIAADCTAFAYANIHKDFMKNKITLIGCPKLDSTDYSKKLTDILINNEIKSITILRMEVPCCSGIVNAIKKALINSEKMIPWQVITISTDGRIIED